MSSELLDDLLAAFIAARNDASVRGALLRGDGSCLSAGLDLKEVITLDEAGLDTFLERLDAAFDTAFRFPKPLAVSVHGHAIAGGLIIALCGDFVALGQGDYQVGLTELAVGIPFPRIAWEIVRAALPLRAVRKLVNEAGTHGPKEAFELGVGDELTDDPLAACQRWLATTTNHPSRAFSSAKRLQREDAYRRIHASTVAERRELRNTLLATRRGGVI